MSTNDKIVALTAIETPAGQVKIGDVVVFQHRLNHVRMGVVLAIAAPNNLVLKQVVCVRYDEDNIQRIYRKPDCTIKNYQVSTVIH